jgi:murein L,D-transpeptidase YafK
LTNPVVRALLAPAAVAAAIALAGCNADGIVPAGRAQAPLSEKTVALIESKNMDKESPILVRVFKEEAELEVWKKNRDGQYALLKTYPICRWSGDLGPKKKQGDRQAPEGFYTITPGQMNPNSNYYLAFNTGYPNAYDRAWGRTGSELMVHGDCSSRGCYAMTDTQIVEIYALARESFFGGQKEFQFQAYPFHMTALNMAKHRNNPNFAFWKMLKEGSDHFEATHQEPKVAVCEKRYVFDAVPRDGSGSLSFSPRGKCPVYQLDPVIASTVLDYRRNQQVKMANYIARDVATAPPHVGDGGTNPVFAGAMFSTGQYDSAVFRVASTSSVPGALPRVPNPPGTTIPRPRVNKPTATASKPAPAARTPAAPASEPVVMASVPVPQPAPLPKDGEAPQTKPATIASLLGNIFGGSRTESKTHVVAAAQPENEPATASESESLRGANTEMAAKPKAKPTAKSERAAPGRTATAPPIALHPKPHKAAPPKPVAVAHNVAPPAPKAPASMPHKPPVKQAVKVEKPRANPVAKTQVAKTQVAKASAQPPAPEPQLRSAFAAPPASSNGLLSGAQPVMAAGSFSMTAQR